MSKPNDNFAEIEHEIALALIAIHHRQFADAQRHIHLADVHGANHQELEHALVTMDNAEKASDKRAKRIAWLGPLLASLAYLILAMKQPGEWTFPVWAALALLVVPIAIGWMAGWEMGPEKKMGQKLRSGFWCVGTPLFIYTIIALSIIRAKIGVADSGGSVALVSLTVAMAYFIISGGIAGLVAAHLAYRFDKYQLGART